jgi:hypothetical protein
MNGAVAQRAAFRYVYGSSSVIVLALFAWAMIGAMASSK